MATGKASDFKIYNEQFFGGMTEQLTQFSNAMNAASNNALRVIPQMLKGDYEYESFFQNITNSVTRRDTTSVATATDLALTQDELVSVKLNRKIGPVANTIDSFRKIQEAAGPNGQESLSFLLGGQIAKAIEVDYLNTMLTALTGALLSKSDLVHQNVGSNLSTAGLVHGLSKMGDNADKIVAWVMHSKAYYDLVRGQIAANIDGVSNFNVQTGTAVTLNRPVIITDSSSLIYHPGGSDDSDEYLTLGLVQNAAVVKESEERDLVSEVVTGNENLIVRLQGEYAFNLGLKGFKWDVQNGAANPNSTALGTGSNWDSVMASVKNLAGVVIRSTSN